MLFKLVWWELPHPGYATALSIIFVKTLGVCSSTQFQCANGECISSLLACNSNNDCGDGSNEIGCGKSVLLNHLTTHMHYLSLTFRFMIMTLPVQNQLLWCILCTAIGDFLGPCSSSQFQCHTGECVSSSLVCDLNKDCRDSGSDETGCGMHNTYKFYTEWLRT